jgi:hypothetical protein
VITEVMNGTPPSGFWGDVFSLPRVQGLVGAEALWELLQDCWLVAARRPNMSQVRLNLLSFESHRVSPGLRVDAGDSQETCK